MIYPTKEFWKIFKATEGALSTAEALAIINIAVQAPKGVYIEFGVYKGKSAISAAVTLKKYDEYDKQNIPEFILVEPLFKNNDWAISVVELIDKNISKGSLVINVIGDISVNVINNYNNYSYVFVDSGSHGGGLPMQEVKLLEDRIIEGGIIAFHDYKNQFTEVEQAYNYLVSTGKYEKIEIDWQAIFDYVKENNLEENNCSWHLYPELPHPPNFVGALRRK
jgi:hypothetical protein